MKDGTLTRLIVCALACVAAYFIYGYAIQALTQLTTEIERVIR